jgi:hypothetical protein
LLRNSFDGFTYNSLSREYDWFSKPPNLITPYELVKWAITCCGWATRDNAPQGKLYWWGPSGPTPWTGSRYIEYTDDGVALQVMRSHYSHWWNQRETVKKAFELLDAAEAKPDSLPGFVMPDETDNGFKGTEED